jgi:hypothetical protein
MDDGVTRQEIHVALALAERGFTERIGAAWRESAELIGYRLRPEAAITWSGLATLVSAAARGLILGALARPDIATARVEGRPFGTDPGAEEPTTAWSLSALGLAALAEAFLEPDPDAVWDEARVAALRVALERPAARMVERAGLARRGPGNGANLA